MTVETYELENRKGVSHESSSVEPYRNPSYPVRDHFSERATLEAALRSAEERLTKARQKLEANASVAGNSEAVRLYHQLLGVRDQIAECARRMPLEAGELYHEDKESFERATAALERVWKRWETTAS